MNRILITGCNRGIGLQFVEHYAKAGWRVFAACRQPAMAVALQSLVENYEHVSLHALDVSDSAQIRGLAELLADEPIDILLNNAGVYASGSNQFGEIDKDIWMQALEINTIGPVLMAEAFVPNLQKGELKIIANVGSKVGSVDDNQSGGGYGYRSAKSALNQVTKSLSIDLAAQGIKAVVLHPGWVQTDMGGPNALINTEQSVAGMTRVLEELSPEQSGCFLNFDGSEIPW